VNLLNVVRTDSFGPRKGSVPLMVEYKVNPETAPFLVSSTRAFVWVTPKATRLRSAVRKFGTGGVTDVFRTMLETIADTGVEGKWDNVHPPTPEGLAAARAHLAYYDLKEMDVVAHPKTDISVFGLGEAEVERADWVPADWAVVLPTDKDFVGFLVTTGDRYVVVVHNSSRAVAVVRP